MDVHSEHLAPHGRGSRNRRAALARLRDLVSVREVQNSKEKERAGREEAALRRVQAADKDRESLLREGRKKARERQKARQALSRKAFGEESWFTGAQQCGADASSAAISLWGVALPAFDGLPGAGVPEVWETCAKYPRYSGLRNQGFACYVTSVAQVLLRIPAVALFLQRHERHCEVGVEGGCVTCVLRATQHELVAQSGKPLLVVKRGVVDESFAAEGQHDVADFL